MSTDTDVGILPISFAVQSQYVVFLNADKIISYTQDTMWWTPKLNMLLFKGT